ncbi:TetR/AcrR family transcriptional regulator [Marimonas arenosa]|uniref:TetR/AcrR family transcriptional regulator n=1 Tax=Marimonas arenosa TaxID=1795305 RepID=A0AAE4B3Y7_9RHOB|nr:TetR/AcrR family transcriptional regulator [Marimonas arenosa]MDQ2090528.1 TetR/AcrR family transcriptional regulator [Marimonas arenosa]
MSSQNPNARTRILNAAWNLLEKGGSKVRMSDIAKAAGVSRQAVYLHFPSRAELLIETTRHIDEAKAVDDRLAPSRAATNGRERLQLFVEAWAGHIPEIYGVGRALMAMQDNDEEARKAWGDRMQAVRHGCAAAVSALAADGELRSGLTEEKATDLLWTLLSVRNWEQLTLEAGWSQEEYLTALKDLAFRGLTDTAD